MFYRNVKESSVGRCLGDNKCLNMNLLTACLLFLISIAYGGAALRFIRLGYDFYTNRPVIGPAIQDLIGPH